MSGKGCFRLSFVAWDLLRPLWESDESDEESVER